MNTEEGRQTKQQRILGEMFYVRVDKETYARHKPHIPLARSTLVTGSRKILRQFGAQVLLERATRTNPIYEKVNAQLLVERNFHPEKDWEGKPIILLERYQHKFLVVYNFLGNLPSQAKLRDETTAQLASHRHDSGLQTLILAEEDQPMTRKWIENLDNEARFIQLENMSETTQRSEARGETNPPPPGAKFEVNG